MPWSNSERESHLEQTLIEMKTVFNSDPEWAVRSQAFIKIFHNFIANDFEAFLTPAAKKAGVKVIEEAKIFGSFKSKDVDVAVIHPVNGPLILTGVRSQMSSVGKNALTYYQDIIGEAISLQERFPMTTTGYAYVHPSHVVPWKTKRGKWTKKEYPNHKRYARMYEAIAARDDRLYKHQTGSYDQFSYSVIDFNQEPILLDDSVVQQAVPDVDMSIKTLVPRLVETFHSRNLWVENIFHPTGSLEFPDSDEDNITELDDTLVSDDD